MSNIQVTIPQYDPPRSMISPKDRNIDLIDPPSLVAPAEIVGKQQLTAPHLTRNSQSNQIIQNSAHFIQPQGPNQIVNFDIRSTGAFHQMHQQPIGNIILPPSAQK